MRRHAAFVRSQGVATRAVRAGRAPDPTTGAVVPGICQSTTFAQPGNRLHDGHAYSRCSNPTVSALEEALGALEEAPPAVAFTSGLAAITALMLATCETGDELIVSAVSYGGTIRLCERVLRPLGVKAVYVDTADPRNVAEAITARTRLILLETPANPTLRLTDIAAIVEVARRRAEATRELAIPVAVDNTFLTAGVAATDRDDLAAELAFSRNAEGTALAPFEAWLLLRGLKTLALRLDRQHASALVVARFLAGRPEIRSLRFPGLADHPGARLHARQARGPGCVLSFELPDEASVELFARQLRLFPVAVSFGSVGSSLCCPARMSHASIPDARRALAPPPALVRLSIGIEAPEDLVEDLGRALDALSAASRIASSAASTAPSGTSP